MPKAENNVPREPKYTPAPPDYGEEPLYMESEEGRLPLGRSKESLTNKLVLIGIAVLVSILLVGIFMSPVNSKQHQADITRLENDLVAMRETDKGLDTKAQGAVSALNAQITRIDSLQDAIGNTATKPELATLNNKVTELAALNNKLNDLATKVELATVQSGLTAEITALKSEIATIKADLKAIEEDIKDLESGQYGQQGGYSSEYFTLVNAPNSFYLVSGAQLGQISITVRNRTSNSRYCVPIILLEPQQATTVTSFKVIINNKETAATDKSIAAYEKTSFYNPNWGILIPGNTETNILVAITYTAIDPLSSLWNITFMFD